jgi:hypothetical protein
MRTLSFDTVDRMKYIGYYQMAGGILGLILFLRGFIYQQSLSGFIFLIYLIAFLLFSFSIYSGNLLRKGNIKGFSLSTWNQILQIVQFSISAIGFEYYSGIFFNIGFQWTEKFIPDFNLGLSGYVIRYAENNTNNIAVYINLIPLIIIYYIFKSENEIEERKQLAEAADKLNLEQIPK